MLKYLNKKQEQIIRSLQGRHGRKKSEFCLCEGIKACKELQRLRPELIELCICVQDFNGWTIPGIDFVQVSRSEFERFSSLVNSEGVFIIAKRPDLLSDEKPVDPFILILDRISDPGNLGTIFRTASAAGLNDIWLTKGTSDPYSPKVIRAALGLQFSLKIRISANLVEALKEVESNGYNIAYQTVPNSGRNLFTEKELFNKTAISFGNESHGLPEVNNCRKISIPMPGNAESLNVAQAVTVVVFEYIRRSVLS